jgi:hypothetical protein
VWVVNPSEGKLNTGASQAWENSGKPSRRSNKISLFIVFQCKKVKIMAIVFYLVYLINLFIFAEGNQKIIEQ